MVDGTVGICPMNAATGDGCCEMGDVGTEAPVTVAGVEVVVETVMPEPIPLNMAGGTAPAMAAAATAADAADSISFRYVFGVNNRRSQGCSSRKNSFFIIPVGEKKTNLLQIIVETKLGWGSRVDGVINIIRV
jgi:hypothetical protein